MTDEQDHEAWVRAWLEAQDHDSELPTAVSAALERLWSRAAGVVGPSLLEVIARPAFVGAAEKFRCMAHVHVESARLHLDGLRTATASAPTSEIRDGFRFLLTEFLTALSDAVGPVLGRTLRASLSSHTPLADPHPVAMDSDRCAGDRGALLAVTRLLACDPGAVPWTDVVLAVGAAVPVRAATAVVVRGGHARVETWHRPGVAPDTGEGHARIAFGALAGPSVAAASVEVARHELLADPQGGGEVPPGCLVALPLAVASRQPFGVLQFALGRIPTAEDVALLAAITTHLATTLELHEALRTAGSPGARSAQGDMAQRELVSVISHDLRNPLSAILMSVALLLRAPPPTDGRRDGRRQLEVIKRSADQMNRMIQNLVDAAVLEADALVIHPREEPVAALVDEALEALRGFATNRQITLMSDIPEGLPAVFVQRDRIVQALANVITLGIKFAVGRGTVTVRARTGDGEVLLDVEDMGTGLSAEDLPHVFERGWWDRRGARMGTGLGLFVAHGILEAHRGRLWVDALPGTGSTFRFALPTAG